MKEQNSESGQLTQPVQFIILPRYASFDGALRWLRKYPDPAGAPSASRLQRIKGGLLGRATAHGHLLADVVRLCETVLAPKEAILAAFQLFKSEETGKVLPFEGMRARFEFRRDALPEKLQEPKSLDGPACRLVHDVAGQVSMAHLDSLKISYFIGRQHRGNHSAFEVLVLPLALRRPLTEKNPPAPDAPGRLEAKWYSSSEMLGFWTASASILIPNWVRSHAS